MSADRPDTFVDDRHADVDPYGIVPDDFLRAYPQANSIPEALRLAERATATTDPDALPRCPECESIEIRQKPGRKDWPNQRSEAYRCAKCGAHFDEPAPSREELRPGSQTTLTEVRR